MQSSRPWSLRLRHHLRGDGVPPPSAAGKGGLIQARFRDSALGPRRKYYALTEQGREELAQFPRQFPGHGRCGGPAAWLCPGKGGDPMNPTVRKLLRQNNAREKALSPESQAGMTDVVVYLRGQDLSRLAQEEIRREVIALQDMGHKRLALETGEDPVHNPIEYVLESIDTIYGIKHKNGAIRRVNVKYRRHHGGELPEAEGGGNRHRGGRDIDIDPADRSVFMFDAVNRFDRF